ncbi:plasmid replication protein RepC [Rhizobium grahamii]|uniref:Replication protein C n=1 Tax=Rhizobium grahamii TaxID=1120045 RepID=A0A370KEE5_9HYPH|nr:plasmid replication protein RepC [Rhizobium grahamii]RDJ02012.1 replication protein C [Rhizobium grahamii]
MEDYTDDRRPVGRRVTPARTAFRRLAELTELGSVTRGQLAVLAQTLPCTGLINGTESHLLTVLVNTAPAEAFSRSGRPIVFKSNRQLAFEVGRSAGRVSRILSRLFDLGLVTMQDSGNYKRYSVRNPHGEIAEGFGVDLRILVARYGELNENVNRARAEKRAKDAAARRYRGALRNVRYALSSLEGCTSVQAVGNRINRVANIVGIPTKATEGKLRRATAVIESCVDRLMLLTSAQSNPGEKTTHPYALNDKQHESTLPNQLGSNGLPTEKLAETAQRRAGKEHATSVLDQHQQKVRTSTINFDRPVLVGIRDVLRAAPSLTDFGCAPRNWSDLVQVAPFLCRLVGITELVHCSAINQMGRQQAAVAVAITVEKTNRLEVKSPNGYLRGMTKRAAAGELRLSRSVFGLAARSPPREIC